MWLNLLTIFWGHWYNIDYDTDLGKTAFLSDHGRNSCISLWHELKSLTKKHDNFLMLLQNSASLGNLMNVIIMQQTAGAEF